MSETQKINPETPHVEAPAEPIDVEVFTDSRPVGELPRVDSPVKNGHEFWSRRSLRPNMPGPNFHNLPVLNLGISIEAGEASLSVPSVDYLNTVAEGLNPNGFRFVETEGYLAGESFFQAVGKKEFPVCTSGSYRNFLKEIDLYGKYLDFRREGPRVFADQYPVITTNLKEHDLATHSGIIGLPGSEADKIADYADQVSRLGSKLDAIEMTPEIRAAWKDAREYGGARNVYDLIAGRFDGVMSAIANFALLSPDEANDSSWREFINGLIDYEFTSIEWKLKSVGLKPEDLPSRPEFSLDDITENVARLRNAGPKPLSRSVGHIALEPAA